MDAQLLQDKGILTVSLIYTVFPIAYPMIPCICVDWFSLQMVLGIFDTKSSKWFQCTTYLVPKYVPLKKKSSIQ